MRACFFDEACNGEINSDRMPQPVNTAVEDVMRCFFTNQDGEHVDPCGEEGFRCWQDDGCRDAMTDPSVAEGFGAASLALWEAMSACHREQYGAQHDDDPCSMCRDGCRDDQDCHNSCDAGPCGHGGPDCDGDECCECHNTCS